MKYFQWASIDLETRSTVDLRKAGVHVYATHPDTEVWVLCYSLDDDPVRRWLPGEKIPADLSEHIRCGGKLRAWNANFERIILREILTPRHSWPEPSLNQWYCTAAQAAAMSLPRSLDEAARVLGLNVRKDKEGAGLMMRMCRPRGKAADGSPTWWSDQARLQRLADYCARDVEVERELASKLRPLDPCEREVFLLDARINDHGVLLDRVLVDAAHSVVTTATARLNEQLRQTTGGHVSAATKSADMTRWLAGQGVDTESVAKSVVQALLKDDRINGVARRALELRNDAAKSSTAKLKAMQAAACPDGRIRGTLLYHGAGTGRWSGKLVQLQNMPRGTVKLVELAIPYIIEKNVDLIEALFGPALEVVSSSLRSCLVAAPDHTFMVADYANIEGRVTAWLAGEGWKIRAFREFDCGAGPDLYKLAYSRSFGIAVDQVDGDQRQIGKVMELALGFQGGAMAFQVMAQTYSVSVSADEAENLKEAWRLAHPAVVALWRDMEKSAFRAVTVPGSVEAAAGGRIKFRASGGFLWMILPSGRSLAYANPAIARRPTPWGAEKTVVTFWGIDTHSHKWSEQKGYGGLWTENAVQAIARDVMASAMLRLDSAGYPIVCSVHDEVIAEVANGFGSLQEFQTIMTAAQEWATGCPIAVSGWSGTRYRKG
ncbi:MAG: DNA polymerase [Rhodospirillaceae bacterium]